MTSKRTRSGCVALALCGILGLQPAVAAAAEHMIGVFGSWSHPSCGQPTPNNAYFAEAWGFDAFGTKVCELIVHASVPPRGFGQCNSLNPFAPATQHAPRITFRNATTYQFVQALPTLPASVPLTPWTPLGNSPVPSPAISHSIPAHGSCPASQIVVASFGFDTP